MTEAPGAGENKSCPIVLPHSGPVAQLGARFHGMEEVVGSIPTRSTNYSGFDNSASASRHAGKVVGSISTGSTNTQFPLGGERVPAGLIFFQPSLELMGCVQFWSEH